ncbi:MAG: PD-(D/E)XK nuclease family protein [Acidimicrobiales bacterium]
MELTSEQRAVVDHEAPRVVVMGRPGTGKTVTLLGRYRRLLERHRASRVLVLCADRAAADRFVDALLPLTGQGFDSLPVTTVYGLAFDIVSRSGRAVRLAAAAERRVDIARLLAVEDPSDWPVLGGLLGRPGFTAEVAAAFDAATEAGLDVADAAGGPWPELAGFARRFRASMAATGRLDPAALLDEAVALAPAHRARFDHVIADVIAEVIADVIADDAGALSPSGARLVGALTGEPGPVGLTAAGAALGTDIGANAVEVTLTQPFRVVPPGRLVRCDHPSLEPEAVAAELLRRHQAGVAWSAMAVLVRHLGRRARSIGRALARHGIPVVPVPALAPDEPVVRAVIDLLRWVDGDEAALDRLLVSPLARLTPTAVRRLRRDPQAERPPHLVALRDGLRARAAAGDTPADLAYEAWAAGLAQVGATSLGAVDDRALDGLVSFVDGLVAYADGHPGATLAGTLAAIEQGALAPTPWRAAASAGVDGVTIAPISAAGGREWHTVVVAGCVEGELPRAGAGSAPFDLTALGDEPPFVRERRLFALATSRATHSLVATAAPAPGVLLSRFVEAWPTEHARFLAAPGQPPPVRPATASTTPIAPERRLVLSASQLDTYDDCPLRYAYQYVLRARDEPGVHASLGILAHEVLADFCDPDRPEPVDRTLDGLLAVAATHWRDEVARYRPQIEEVRRDLVAMLTAWWECEGGQEALAPEVLAVERRFDIEVGPHRLVGSIDRVDRCGDGGLAVIDYKTSKREPRPDDVVDDLQLAVYHLAATRDEGLARLGAPTRLELRYLRTMNVFQQPITDDHAEHTEERVLAVADRILAEDFEPSVDANCRTCAFHRLCPLQPEGRMS